MTMRLAVFADLHGNLPAFEAALAALDALGGADRVWLLGDLAMNGPFPRETVARVQALVAARAEDTTEVIGGNTDRYLVTAATPPGAAANDEAEFAERLATLRAFHGAVQHGLGRLDWPTYEFLAKIVGREVGLDVPGYGYAIGVHAAPGDDEQSILPDTPDDEIADALLDRAGRLMLGGHTHIQMNRSVGAWRVVNPGSVGFPKDHAGRACWALLTFGDDGVLAVDFQATPYDAASVAAALRAQDHPLLGRLLPGLGEQA